MKSTEITRQLLAFARQQPIAPRIVDLPDAITGMLKMLRRLIGADIDLKWQFDAKPCGVMIDPSQVDQILANLCVNARDAISGSGTIKIEVFQVALDEDFCQTHPGSTPGLFTRLTVSDSGCGIDRQTVERIFEPFFTTKQPGLGTGLGLSTVYGIVKQNDGYIEVISAPGAGTTINIYLPWQEGESSTTLPDVPPEPAGAKGTIVVVDDEESILRLLRSQLSALGYTVLTAKSSQQALDIFTSNNDHVSLLLTDIIMPGMNGRELAQTLRLTRPELKVVYMSGYAAEVIAGVGIELQKATFLQKPFTRERLAETIHLALSVVPGENVVR